MKEIAYERITRIQNPFKFFIGEDEGSRVDSIINYLYEISGPEIEKVTIKEMFVFAEHDEVKHAKHDKIPADVSLCKSVIHGGKFLTREKNDFDAVISDFLFEREMKVEKKSQSGGFLLALLGYLNRKPKKKGIYRVISAAPRGNGKNGWAIVDYPDALYFSKVFEEGIGIPFALGESKRAWDINFRQAFNELSEIRLKEATFESLRKLHTFFKMLMGTLSTQGIQEDVPQRFARTFLISFGDEDPSIEFKSIIEEPKSFRDLFPDVVRYYLSWNQNDYNQFKDLINIHYKVINSIFLKSTNAKIRFLYDEILDGIVMLEDRYVQDNFLHFQESGNFNSCNIDDIRATARVISSNIKAGCEIPNLRSRLCTIYDEIADCKELNEDCFKNKTSEIKKMVRFMPVNTKHPYCSTFKDFSIYSQSEGSNYYYTSTDLLKNVLHLMINNAKDRRGGGLEEISIIEGDDILYIGIKRKNAEFDENLYSWIEGNESLKKFIFDYNLGDLYFECLDEDGTEKVIDLSVRKRVLLGVDKKNFVTIFQKPGYLILCIYRA